MTTEIPPSGRVEVCVEVTRTDDSDDVLVVLCEVEVLPDDVFVDRVVPVPVEESTRNVSERYTSKLSHIWPEQCRGLAWPQRRPICETIARTFQLEKLRQP